MLALLVGVTVVAVAVRAPLLGDSYSAPDTTHYLEVAHNIFSRGFPDNLRPPGYSLLLAVFDQGGADPVGGVVLLQNIIGIFLPAAMALAGWRFFSPSVGLITGFLAAASPLMILTEQLALADYLFGVAIFAATALLAEAALRIRSGKLPWQLLIGVGVAFAVATLIRANGLLALVAIPFVMLIAAKQWRSFLRASAISLAAMMVILAPWCIHNLIRFGNANVASEGGVSLYARAINWGGVPPSPDSPEGRLALSIYNTTEAGESGAPTSGLPTTAVFNALVRNGMTVSEASNAMGGLARDAIFRHPDIYFDNAFSILESYRNFYDPHAIGPSPNNDHIASTRHYFQYLNLPEGDGVPTPEELSHRRLPGDSMLTRAPWQVGQGVTRILYLITVGGLLVLLLPFIGSERMRLASIAFLTVLLLAMIGGSLTAVFSARYDAMLAPLIWILLAACALRVAEVASLAVRTAILPRLRSG